MERLYQKMARAPVVGLALVLSVVAFVAFAYFDQARPPGTPGVVALQLAFSTDTFHHIIALWGAAGVQAYQVSTLYVDSWFPISYALLFASLIAVLTHKPGKAVSKSHLAFFVVPFVAMLLDWIENALHLVLLRDPSHLSPSLVLIASVAAAVKWGIIAFSILVVLYFFAQRIRARLVRRGT
ncbi:MAG: hypothetical protein H5T68_03585 [Chloroflexi bacterium]|nr:hypothetical protein [Chloroflexota bacterium]